MYMYLLVEVDYMYVGILCTGTRINRIRTTNVKGANPPVPSVRMCQRPDAMKRRAGVITTLLHSTLALEQ